LIRTHEHIQYKLSPTVSILNVLHLPDLYQQALDLKLINKEEWYLNILEFPGHYNIQILPEPLNKEVRARYATFIDWASQNEIPHTVISSFQDILNYMSQESANSSAESTTD